ncbi:MAG: hypothetical protein MZV63_48165 [Marinilabiliales bacterium]|nr:hypothetical protein [Marinilabiliales bacterium]
MHLKTDSRELYDYTLSVVHANGLEIINIRHRPLRLRLPGDPLLSIRTYYEEVFLKAGNPHHLSFIQTAK